MTRDLRSKGALRCDGIDRPQNENEDRGRGRGARFARRRVFGDCCFSRKNLKSAGNDKKWMFPHLHSHDAGSSHFRIVRVFSHMCSQITKSACEKCVFLRKNAQMLTSTRRHPKTRTLFHVLRVHGQVTLDARESSAKAMRIFRQLSRPLRYYIRSSRPPRPRIAPIPAPQRFVDGAAFGFWFRPPPVTTTWGREGSPRAFPLRSSLHG